MDYPPTMPGGVPPMGGAPQPQPPAQPGLLGQIGNYLGLGDNGNPASGQPQQVGATGQDYQKMQLAQALMGGGASAAPQTTFAGGLAAGLSPMIHAGMMNKIFGPGQATPQPKPQLPAAPDSAPSWP